MIDPFEENERALLDGLASLADEDLLATMLGSRASRRLARRLLEHCGGLRGLGRAGPDRLAQVHGIGRARALRVLACVEVGHRIHRLASAPRRPIETAEDVVAVAGPRLATLEHEQMWLLALDGRSQLRGMRCVAQGGRHGLVVTAREILGVALADAASAFVLVHNHPSGSAQPSPEDVVMTRAVAAAAQIVGVPMVDHVVVAGDRHQSMLEAGLFDGEEAAGDPETPHTLHAASKRTGAHARDASGPCP